MFPTFKVSLVELYSSKESCQCVIRQNFYQVLVLLYLTNAIHAKYNSYETLKCLQPRNENFEIMALNVLLYTLLSNAFRQCLLLASFSYFVKLHDDYNSLLFFNPSLKYHEIITSPVLTSVI